MHGVTASPRPARGRCRFRLAGHALLSLALGGLALHTGDAAAAGPGKRPAGVAQAALRDAAVGAEAVLRALALVGVPYRWGGSMPATGLDCSGLVHHVFRQIGVDAPRDTRGQSRAGATVARRNLQPGDLVFFNTLRRAYSHVGIYLGDGRFVHAPSAGAEVRIESMEMSYWRQRYDGARRLGPAGTTAPVEPTRIATSPAPGDGARRESEPARLPATADFDDTASFYRY